MPFAVASYIAAAYWFTSSTSFANPAVTIARSLSDTFAGIRPSDVPMFILAQLAGALCATFLFRWLVPKLKASVESVVVPARGDYGGVSVASPVRWSSFEIAEDRESPSAHRNRSS
jgi:glycerol uptake facilitator-like aquaporin